MTEVSETGQREGLVGGASAKVEDAASAAQEKASELREHGSARLSDQFDQRSSQAGSQVRSLAEALRRSSDQLGSEGKSGTSQLTRQAADRIDRVGSYLEQKRGGEFMHDVEGFAQRRPWMIAGVTVLAGVAAARFVKASAERRHSEYGSSSRQWPTRPEANSAASGGSEPAGSDSDREALGGGASAMSRPETGEALARDPYGEAR